MDLNVNLDGPGTRVAAIYRAILDAILDGRLVDGDRLPPTRDLARQLSVSRNTVASAYDRLTAEGHLVARVGSGSFVQAGRIAAQKTRAAPRGGGVRPRRLWEGLPGQLGRAVVSPRYDFSVGMPDGGLFPIEAWRRLLARELRASNLDLGGYGDPAGLHVLREAIARHIGISRAVRASADDVVVTNGAQQALDLIGRLMIGPGDCVAIEEPGYPPARGLFASLGARVVGAPVDEEGIVVSALPAKARLVYVTPSHQFPLGVVMSRARRHELLAWAERRGALIVEDDYDSEFRYRDRPLDPIQSLDRHGQVVYVGSFSKTLSPILRLGFVVAPESLQPALRRAKALSDWQSETVSQLTLARFMSEGMLAAHVRKATRVYAERRGAVLEELGGPGAYVEPVSSFAGLHLCALTRPDLDAARIAARAAAAGIAVRAISDFAMSAPARDGLVIGFGGIEVERIRPGLRRLASLVGELSH